MINPETGSNNWKIEQIKVFKKYIKNFKPGSIEYIRIANGIKDLEQIGY